MTKFHHNFISQNMTWLQDDKQGPLTCVAIAAGNKLRVLSLRINPNIKLWFSYIYTSGKCATPNFESWPFRASWCSSISRFRRGRHIAMLSTTATTQSSSSRWLSSPLLVTATSIGPPSPTLESSLNRDDSFNITCNRVRAVDWAKYSRMVRWHFVQILTWC